MGKIPDEKILIFFKRQKKRILLAFSVSHPCKSFHLQMEVKTLEMSSI